MTCRYEGHFRPPESSWKRNDSAFWRVATRRSLPDCRLLREPPVFRYLSNLESVPGVFLCPEPKARSALVHSVQVLYTGTPLRHTGIFFSPQKSVFNFGVHPWAWPLFYALVWPGALSNNPVLSNGSDKGKDFGRNVPNQLGDRQPKSR